MHEVIDAARSIAPRIRAAADQIEAERQLPPTLVAAMAEAKLFSLLTPVEYGGADVDPVTAILAVEQIGRADGSAGWLATNSSYEAVFMSWLSPETVAEMRSSDPIIRMAGAIQPQGTAYEVDGGFRLTGHWDFVSGIHQSNWVSLGAWVLDGPEGTVRLDDAGNQLARVFFLPPDDGEVVDHWDTLGMRGTGSHDFLVDDIFVPSDRAMRNDEQPYARGPRYDLPFSQVWGWSLHGGNAVGMARGALDDLNALAQGNASKVTPTLLRDRPHVQSAFAQSEAIVRSARAFLLEAMGAAWESACGDAAEFPTREREAHLAVINAVHECSRAVTLLYDTVGTPAIFRANRLERTFRDLNVAKHHIAALRRHYETIGAGLLGAG